MKPPSRPQSQTKSELRQDFRRRLLAFDDPAKRERAVRQLCDRLRGFLAKFSGTIWAAYQPTGFEPDIRSIFHSEARVTWVFPRVDDQHIHFYRPEATSSFTLNKWGILEPDPGRSKNIPLAQLTGLLVPALTFDLNCNRLGRGGGYYDRALAELNSINPHAVKVGVALDLQISEDPLPTEDFDIAMDRVVTETRSLERKVS